MIDLKSVSMSGRWNHSRVRVLWKDGLLRAFGVSGLLVELKTSEPVRMSGFLGTWITDGDLGPLILKNRCMTCGGPRWWRIMRMPPEELWSVDYA